jgi:CheY-like chemotaxis protein
MGQQLALVVEGDAICLRALSAALDALNVRYKRNASGQYVIEQVRAMTPPPDLILLDLDLPQGDALEIASALRADPAARLIPIILIADESAFDSLPRSQQKWFAGFISKPISRQVLAALIARIAPQTQTVIIDK